MTHTNSLLSLSTLAAAALMAACSSTPTTAPPAAVATTAPAQRMPPPPAATPQPAPQSTVATVSLPDYLDPKNPLSSQRSVFFDFDNFTIKSDITTLIEQHGKFLASHPQVAIKIEGNSDERGSPEYNLALGQKRAEAVRTALKVFGVKETQMEATSWGEEKPKATGHDESAWAQNRRADLQYPNR